MIASHFDKEADRKYKEYTSSIEGVLGEVSSVGRGKKVNPITKEWVERQKLLTNDLIRLDENKS